MPQLPLFAAAPLLWSITAAGGAAAGAQPPAATPGPPPEATADCPKHAVVTGYWPPTNDMLRPWSADPAHNSGGWQGSNWRGHGFDVYAYFPEFPPDGAPFNDPRGADGYIGSPESDFRVDYQDTSTDFWRIMDAHRPLIIITTSRGGDIGWEVEALDGGHGGTGDPSTDWSSDHRPPATLPTRDSIEPRSWDAISSYRGGRQLPSQLPVDAIAAAARALELTSVEIDHATSGNYLSGFMALHGLYYQQISPQTVAAGHIHVGGQVPAADARRLFEATLEAVLARYDAGELGCSGTAPEG